MQKPVAMPRGGITIFLSVTALRPSRTRQASTPARPMSETTAVMSGSGVHLNLRFRSCFGVKLIAGRLRFRIQGSGARFI